MNSMHIETEHRDGIRYTISVSHRCLNNHSTRDARCRSMRLGHEKKVVLGAEAVAATMAAGAAAVGGRRR
jgi:hypothetical protein